MSLRSRALLAVALTIGFYVLALGLSSAWSGSCSFQTCPAGWSGSP